MRRLRLQTHLFLFASLILPILVLAPGTWEALGLCALIIAPLLYLDLTLLRPLLRMEDKALSLLSEEGSERDHDLGIKRLEDQFERGIREAVAQVERLKEVDRAKSEFLSIVSHELRTPLTSIKGSLGLLNSGALGQIPSGCKRMLEIADTETERLIYLINELLDLAKIEAKQLSLNSEWTTVQKEFASITESLLGLTEPRKVTISVKIDIEAEIFCDSYRLKQIVQNLLSNAVKHTAQGGEVHLTFTVDQDKACITVRDFGEGINSEDLDKIFEKFTQASHPSIMTQGTGLGLTIARELVQLHGGSIHVDSQKGHGASFYFYLPEWREMSRGDSGEEKNAA